MSLTPEEDKAFELAEESWEKNIKLFPSLILDSGIATLIFGGIIGLCGGDLHEMPWVMLPVSWIIWACVASMLTVLSVIIVFIIQWIRNGKGN